MKKKQNIKKLQRFRANPINSKRELESQRISYSENKGKKEKKQKYYQEVSKARYRQVSMERKHNSVLNDAKC